MDIFFIFAAQYLYLLPIGILGIYFIVQPPRSWLRMAIFAVSAGILALFLGWVANHLHSDPRPFVVGNFVPLVPHSPDNGFPSDHTLLVATVAMVGMLWNRRLGILLWALALIVGMARIYVGLHHVQDIVASIVISTFAVLLTHNAFKHWHRKIR